MSSKTVTDPDPVLMSDEYKRLLYERLTRWVTSDLSSRRRSNDGKGIIKNYALINYISNIEKNH